MATDTRDLSPYDRRSPENIRRRLERMEHLLESAVRIPGTSKRLGLDVILDVVPVGGSVVAAAMGTWLAWEARNLGVSKWTLARMGGNIGFDMLLGAVPVVGWVADYFFRSNTRNLRLLKRYLDKHHPQSAGGLDPSGTRPR
ncbi:MAG: DUF4112 domain-containing protein [Allosphingosinicella sp.]|uniref:DUF4112 domain-containing protein n=1 Tax=Allosphingosinicella sp. TaxID=2823234 RepID=UPI003923D085